MKQIIIRTNLFLFLRIIFTIFILYKERQALGCPNIPDGSDCDNKNGKAVKGTEPYSNDTTEVIYKKIEEAACFVDKWVVWRMAILIALFSIIVIYYFLENKLIGEKELFIGTFVIAATIYFAINFYKFHMISYVERNIEKGVEILRTRYPN